MVKKDKYYTLDRENYYQSMLLKHSKINNNILLDENSKDRINKSLSDFQYFVNTYFTHFITNEDGNLIPLAKHHLELVEELKSKKIEILAEFFRGAGKTVVFSLFLPIWFMLRKEIHLVLLVSSTEKSAIKMLINIQAELETNQKLIDDFGIFKSDGSWSKGEFTVNNFECKFTATGKGQSVRGLRYKSYRPDYVVIDDIDTDKDCRNKEIIKYQFDWLMQSVVSSMELTKYKLLFVGNRFAPISILDLYSKVEGIKHIKVNAINENGESNWEERYSTNDLLNIKSKIGEVNWLREYMNTPVIIGSVFKEEWLNFKPINNYKDYEYIVTYIDPSYKKGADYKSAITLGYINNEYHIIDIFLKQCTMRDVIEYLYELNDKLLNSAYNMYIEANFNQDIHQLEFDKIAIEKGFALPIRQDKDKKENKIARIESMSVIFENGKIFINNLIMYSLDYKEFYNQIITFPTNKHDDGPDALQSAYVKLNLSIRKSRFEPMTGSRESLQYNHY